MSLELPMAEAPQPQPETDTSLSEAYKERNLGTGAEDKEVAEVRDALAQEEAGEDGELEHRRASTTLDEEEGRARDSQTSAAWEKQNAADLAEALEIDDDSEFTIPRAIAHYKASEIAKAMEALGLEAEDLQDDDYVSDLAQRLNTFAEDATEDGESESDEEGDEKEDPEKEEDEKPKKPVTELSEEEKLAQAQALQTKTLAELNPEQIQDLNTHLQALDGRAKQVNSPLMTDTVTQCFAGILQTPAEQVPMLRKAVDAFATFNQGQIEAAVPAILDQWIGQNMGNVLDHFVPGLAQSFREAQISNGWMEVLGSEEFKGLGLPKHGTEEFDKAIQAVCQKNPWFLNLDPPGPNGEKLPTIQALRLKMAIGARLMAGERITPANLWKQMNEARESGKKDAERHERRVRAGRMLGSGRSRGIIGGMSERSSLQDAFHSHPDHNNDMSGL